MSVLNQNEQCCVACFVNTDGFHALGGRGSVAEWSKALVLGTSPSGRGFESHRCQENTFFSHRIQVQEHQTLLSGPGQVWARWSRGMIRASGARGPGFNSRTSPLYFFVVQNLVETPGIEHGASCMLVFLI